MGYIITKYGLISYKIDNKENHTNKTYKFILDLFVSVIFIPAISGFIGWLLPLQISFPLSIIIGIIDLIWFISRRD